MTNILENNFHNLRLQLDHSDYWDMVISKDDGGSVAIEDGLQTKCLAAYIDTTDTDCIFFNKLYSKRMYRWDEAVSSGLTLYNIGLTGMDNGFIEFRKDKITNEDFLKLLTGSTYSVEEDDYRLQLKRVTGNTGRYDYPLDIIYDGQMQVSRLNGGFYQGFFKTEGYDYQVLPHRITTDWVMEFTLKKQNLEPQSKKTLNDKYPENKGIFFYIGTRAENKWWHFYGHKDGENYDSNTSYSSDYFGENTEYLINYGEEFMKEYYQGDKPYIEQLPSYTDSDDAYFNNCSCDITEKCTGNPTYKDLQPMPYWLNYYCSYYAYRDENERCCNIAKKQKKEYIGETGYYADSYAEEGLNDLSGYGNYFANSEDYLKKDMEIPDINTITTKDGFPLNSANMKDIKTDNKFVFFNRTYTGVTTDTYDPDAEYILRMQKESTTGNNFQLFNRTKTGYTTDNLPPDYYSKNNEYNLRGDLYKNCLGFRIKDDGSIGYRILYLDCENETKYKIEEEYSLPGLIKEDEWVTVTVLIKPLSRNDNICSEIKGKIKFYFYVNGYLKFISREVDNLDFRGLKEVNEKQEGVPYNISLGGGSQGLCDMIMPNFREMPKYVFPIEKNFAGSFIGEFKSFKFYNCFLNYPQIKNNASAELENIYKLK